MYYVFYEAALSPINCVFFDNQQIQFKVDVVGDVNWNIIDHIILGYVDKEAMSVMRHINYWRSRFCLLPADESSAPNRRYGRLMFMCLNGNIYQTVKRLYWYIAM